MTSRLKIGRESDTNKNHPTTSHRFTDIQRSAIHPANFFSPDLTSSDRKLTKLLLNVTIQRSLGPIHVVSSWETTVDDLIKSVLKIYVKEKRRPLLTETESHFFGLHYSQFCLESLNPEEKLISLGSRNFFMCLKPTNKVMSSSCSKEAKKGNTNRLPFVWTRFMDFML